MSHEACCLTGLLRLRHCNSKGIRSGRETKGTKDESRQTGEEEQDEGRKKQQAMKKAAVEEKRCKGFMIVEHQGLSGGTQARGCGASIARALVCVSVFK